MTFVVAPFLNGWMKERQWSNNQIWSLFQRRATNPSTRTCNALVFSFIKTCCVILVHIKENNIFELRSPIWLISFKTPKGALREWEIYFDTNQFVGYLSFKV